MALTASSLAAALTVGRPAVRERVRARDTLTDSRKFIEIPVSGVNPRQARGKLEESHV